MVPVTTTKLEDCAVEAERVASKTLSPRDLANLPPDLLLPKPVSVPPMAAALAWSTGASMVMLSRLTWTMRSAALALVTRSSALAKAGRKDLVAPVATSTAPTEFPALTSLTLESVRLPEKRFTSPALIVNHALANSRLPACWTRSTRRSLDPASPAPTIVGKALGPLPGVTVLEPSRKWPS